MHFIEQCLDRVFLEKSHSMHILMINTFCYRYPACAHFHGDQTNLQEWQPGPQRRHPLVLEFHVCAGLGNATNMLIVEFKQCSHKNEGIADNTKLWTYNAWTDPR